MNSTLVLVCIIDKVQYIAVFFLRKEYALKKEFKKKLGCVGILCSFLASLLTAWRASWEWAVVVLIVTIMVLIGFYIVTVR